MALLNPVTGGTATTEKRIVVANEQTRELSETTVYTPRVNDSYPSGT